MTTVTTSREQASVSGSWLLHPGFIFAGVWAVAFTVWALLPPEEFFRLTGTARYFSLSSLAYLALSLLAFVLGTTTGAALLRATGPARPRFSWDYVRLIPLLRNATTLALLIGLAASAVMLYDAGRLAGGIGSLVHQYESGAPWTAITEAYFLPGRLHGLTSWVHCNTAVAPLGSLGLMLESRNRRSGTFFKGALLVGFANAAFLAVTQSERLALYEFMIPVAVTMLASRIAAREKIRIKRVAVLSVALVVGLAVSWLATEYGRTYLARYAAAVSAPSAGLVGWDQFLTYVVTNVNNGLFTVDHAQQFTFPLYTFNGFLTPLGLDSTGTPLVGPAFSEASRLLVEIYPSSPFTTFSLPGYAFLELGWGGLVLMYWIGSVIGVVYARLRAGELWAIVIYPILVVGLVDSFRIFYWTESRALIAIAYTLAFASTVPRVLRSSAVRSSCRFAMRGAAPGWPAANQRAIAECHDGDPST